MRNDMQIELEVIPTYTTTFDSLFFESIHLSDEAEIDREWTDTIYIKVFLSFLCMHLGFKHHGFGDFAISVYVGGNGGDAILSPGEKVKVKVTFSNNAGFDINLLGDAITSSEIEEAAINSSKSYFLYMQVTVEDDLLCNTVHTLKYPDSYNFMDIIVPEALQPYITYYPAQDVVGVCWHHFFLLI